MLVGAGAALWTNDASLSLEITCNLHQPDERKVAVSISLARLQ